MDVHNAAGDAPDEAAAVPEQLKVTTNDFPACAGLYSREGRGRWVRCSRDPISAPCTLEVDAGRWVLRANGVACFRSAEGAAPDLRDPRLVREWELYDTFSGTFTPTGLIIEPAEAGGQDDFTYADLARYTIAQSSSDWGSAFGDECESVAGDVDDPLNLSDMLSDSDEDVQTIPEGLAAEDPGGDGGVFEASRRGRVQALMEDPSSSLAARVVSLVSMCLVVLSTVMLLVETLPAHQAQAREGEGPWFALESTFVAAFTLEILLRLWATQHRLDFARDPLNIVDVVAVLPYYIELAAGGSGKADGLRVLRVIRVVRAFRLLKIARYAEGIKLVMVVFGQLGDVLVLVLFAVVLSLVLWSACMFYIEGGSISTFDSENQTWTRRNIYTIDGRDEFSPFQSVYASFWWCINSISVVGYGDAVPYAGPSRAIAAVTMVSATFIIAIPASVFGSTFLTEYQKHSDMRLSQAARSEQKESAKVVRLLSLLMESPSVSAAQRNELVKRIMWDEPYCARAIRLLDKHVGKGEVPDSFLRRLLALHSSAPCEPARVRRESVGRMGAASLLQRSTLSRAGGDPSEPGTQHQRKLSIIGTVCPPHLARSVCGSSIGRRGSGGSASLKKDKESPLDNIEPTADKGAS